MQVEALTNQEEVELRAKIEALGLEVTKVPSKSTQHLDEVVLRFTYHPFSLSFFPISLSLIPSENDKTSHTLFISFGNLFLSL